jgi:transposase
MLIEESSGCYSVVLDNIDIDQTLSEGECLLKDDKQMSPPLKSLISILVVVIKLLTNRVGLNRSNSSKSPSSDLNKKKQDRKRSTRNTGGQLGHVGKTLVQVDGPDELDFIKNDRHTLPKGNYECEGVGKRQVFDINI